MPAMWKSCDRLLKPVKVARLLQPALVPILLTRKVIMRHTHTAFIHALYGITYMYISPPVLPYLTEPIQKKNHV